MQIKVIFFDFSGVVASSGYLQWAKMHSTPSKSDETFIEDIFADVDLGRITHSELDHILSSRTGIAKDTILPAVLENVIVDKQIVDLVKQLKKSYKVALLTNYSHEILDIILKVNNLTKLFDEVIISSKHGQVKPHEPFFKTALQIMNIQASEAVFIDDAEINIAGAKKLGIKSIHYTSFDKLLQELRKTGIPL